MLKLGLLYTRKISNVTKLQQGGKVETTINKKKGGKEKKEKTHVSLFVFFYRIFCPGRRLYAASNLRLWGTEQMKFLNLFIRGTQVTILILGRSRTP